MPEIVMSEQAMVFGEVDFPASNENIVALLGALGPKGYVPQMVNEITNNTGAMSTRLSLVNMKNTQIIFNTNRIHILRAGGSSVDVPENFLVSALDILSAIDGVRNLKANRVSIVSERLLSEMSEENINSAYHRIVAIPVEVPSIEWGAKAVVKAEIDGEEIVKVRDVSRIQGFITEAGIQTNFDRVRLMLESSTAPEKIESRYSFEKIAQIAKLLSEQVFNMEVEIKELLDGLV